MSERKKVNLGEILDHYIPYEGNYRHYNEDSVIVAMEEACRQVLELAAENARVYAIRRGSINNVPRVYSDVTVCKHVIINTINQVE